LRFHPSADLLKQAGISSSKAGGQQLYVLIGGKLTAVPVKLGLSDGRSTAITGSGLKAGDAMVVRATTPGSSSSSNGATSGTPRMPRM
jgi:HlyD family secretion protein